MKRLKSLSGYLSKAVDYNCLIKLTTEGRIDYNLLTSICYDDSKLEQEVKNE